MVFLPSCLWRRLARSCIRKKGWTMQGCERRWRGWALSLWGHPRLRSRSQNLERGDAGVLEAHPHRYRDTFAVDMLAGGGSPCDVAKLLGDTIETIGKEYTPFVRELPVGVGRPKENREGLE